MIVFLGAKMDIKPFRISLYSNVLKTDRQKHDKLKAISINFSPVGNELKVMELASNLS